MIRHRLLRPVLRPLPPSSPLRVATQRGRVFCLPHAARMASTLPPLPIFRAIAQHDPASPAVLHSPSGRTFTYGGLLGHVARVRDRLLEANGGNDLDGERVAFLVENSYDYVGKKRLKISPPRVSTPDLQLPPSYRAVSSFQSLIRLLSPLNPSSHAACCPGRALHSRAPVPIISHF